MLDWIVAKGVYFGSVTRTAKDWSQPAPSSQVSVDHEKVEWLGSSVSARFGGPEVVAWCGERGGSSRVRLREANAFSRPSLLMVVPNRQNT